MKIDNIVWGNFTTVSDTLLITDINGNPIVDAIVASLSQGMITFGKIGWVRGLILSTITHGYVTIAIGAGK